jgi:hypothetical protein
MTSSTESSVESTTIAWLEAYVSTVKPLMRVLSRSWTRALMHQDSVCVSGKELPVKKLETAAMVGGVTLYDLQRPTRP